MRSLFLVFSFIVFSFCAMAQEGESGLSVLKIGVGGRTIGMGDAGVTSAVGASSMHYNPAIIAREDRPGLTVMHNSWIEDINTEYLGVYTKMAGYSLGFHVAYIEVGNLELRDRPGEPQGTFDAQYISTGITIAVPLSEQLEAGASAKMLFEKIYVEDAFGYAFDVGLRYRPFMQGGLQQLSLGAALANIGSMSALVQEDTKLPMLFRYGAGYSMPLGSGTNELQLELGGISNTTTGTTHLNVGVEAGYDGIAYLRAGYQSNYEMRGLSYGFGAVFSVLAIDFAYTPFQNDFGSATTISLNIAL
jgi:hypothetical protein